MASLSNDMRLFGVDLRAFWQVLRRPWQGASGWPVVSWLTPAPAVLLLQADGGSSLWKGAAQPAPAIAGTTRGVAPIAPPGGPSARARHLAVELPADRYLTRAFTLPALGAPDVARAAELEARAASPFAADDLLWSHSARATPHGLVVQVVLASSRQARQYLDTQAARVAAAVHSPGQTPELWCLVDGQPVVVPGYGEQTRLASARRNRHLNFGLIGVACLLLLAIALTPSLQLRERALQASSAHAATVLVTQPLLAEREALLRTTETLASLHKVLGESVDPLLVVDLLTTSLPDDTVLQSLRIEGRRVSFSGQTDNAANLLQRLGSLPQLREVRAPTAATRPLGASKEVFSIEFTLAPDAFEPPAAGPAAAQTPVASPQAPTKS